MHAPLEEIKSETAEMLAAQAKARGLSVDEYLKSLLGVTNGENVTPVPTLAEFEADMEAFADGTEHLPASSITYSREDIYLDHD